MALGKVRSVQMVQIFRSNRYEFFRTPASSTTGGGRKISANPFQNLKCGLSLEG
jgi:hypothetical protein